MTNTELPKFHQTFIPILKVLGKNQVIHYTQLHRLVRDQFYSNLPKDILDQKTSTGANTLLDRIGWGQVYLKQGKFIHQPERAMVQITKKGQLALKSENLTLKDLEKDPDFIAHQKAKQSKKVKIDPENSSPQDLIDSGFSQIESKTKDELLEKLKDIDPYYFEKVILILLKEMGYGDFIETSKSRDGGIDGIINQDQLGLEKIYIQAKRYSNNKINELEIRNFIGAMSGDTSKGVFVTTSSFDNSALKKAKEAHHSIILIDGNKLVDLMYQYGVGVQIKSTYQVKEVDEDFFEKN